jgi:hypothetical protein
MVAVFLVPAFETDFLETAFLALAFLTMVFRFAVAFFRTAFFFVPPTADAPAFLTSAITRSPDSNRQYIQPLPDSIYYVSRFRIR